MWAGLATAGAAFFGMFGKMFSWLRQSDAKRAAKAEGQVEYMQETIDDVETGNRSVRRLLTDPAYRKRMLRKYSRPSD